MKMYWVRMEEFLIPSVKDESSFILNMQTVW